MRPSPVLLGLAATAAASPLIIRQENSTSNANSTSNYDSVSDIPSSKTLQWTPCFGTDYTCLNLEVPLDYDDPEQGTTNVAFMKLDAANQPAMGDVIINPGGPGGGGVDWLFRSRKLITDVIGPNYNIIGMDPRGVNNSGLVTDPLRETPATRDRFAFDLAFELEPRSPESVKQTWTLMGAYGDFATAALPPDTKYANTLAVSDDMVHYAELLAEEKGEDKESAKVNFFGSSYGSILGTAFAQRHPDRVGRFIIDGVMGGDDYFSGEWTKSIQQADEAVEAFASKCFEAGPLCAFFANDSSADAILERIDTILEELMETPLRVSDPQWVVFPVFVNHMDLRRQITSDLYNALNLWHLLAETLVGVENKNGSLLAARQGKGFPSPSDDNYEGQEYSLFFTKLTIACMDQDGRYNISSADEYQEYIGKMEESSKYIGSWWSTVITPNCHRMNISPPESQKFDSFKETQTSNPILFTNNRIDPVTSSLEEMKGYFPGAGSLYQDAIGHGITNSPSNCTHEYTKKYMETGELPPPDTLCETNEKVFEYVPPAPPAPE